MDSNFKIFTDVPENPIELTGCHTLRADRTADGSGQDCAFTVC